MKRKLLCLALALTLAFASVPTALAADSDKAMEAAMELYKLGLFAGVGDPSAGPDFALERIMTRIEGVTMLVRLMGQESNAQSSQMEHPFTDVAEWAAPYVGYAYNNRLTAGTGESLFGSDDLISASQYLTFVLRALGYESGTDFEWDKAWELSDELGITHGEYNAENNAVFLRGDAAIVSHAALSCKQKGKELTLLDSILKTVKTGFGDPELHAILLSFNPESFNVGDKQDQYSYKGTDLEDAIFEALKKHFRDVKINGPAQMGPFAFTKDDMIRVECKNDENYGKSVKVEVQRNQKLSIMEFSLRGLKQVEFDRDDDETSFGDKAVKEYLLSLKPTSFRPGPETGDSYSDMYWYSKDTEIAERIVKELPEHIKVLSTREGTGSADEGSNFTGTSVVCDERGILGRNIYVMVYPGDGTLTQYTLVIREKSA